MVEFELQKKVLKLYKLGFKCKYISEKLNLTFGQTSHIIYKHRKENGLIVKRTDPTSCEIKRELFKRFKGGSKLRELSEEFGIKIPTIYQYIRQNPEFKLKNNTNDKNQVYGNLKIIEELIFKGLTISSIARMFKFNAVSFRNLVCIKELKRQYKLMKSDEFHQIVKLIESGLSPKEVAEMYSMTKALLTTRLTTYYEEKLKKSSVRKKT